MQRLSIVRVCVRGRFDKGNPPFLDQFVHAVALVGFCARINGLRIADGSQFCLQIIRQRFC